LLDNLEINNVGGIAIRAPNSTNVTISNNHIHDTGQGGILLSGGDRPTLQDSGNLIENNYIHNYDDVLFNNSPAIDIGGVGVTTSHNLIENSSGNAIVLTGNDHLIEKNEISRICQQSADCGAIHSGRDWTYRGNIIRYNYLHDFSGYELDRASLDITRNILKYIYSGARGIYLDDGVSGFTVFGNILDNANSMSIQIGGGRDNRIENNIIKTNGHAITVDQRWPSFDWNAMRNTLQTMPISSPVWLAKYPELVAPMAHDTWPEGNRIQRNIIISTALKSHTFQYWLPTQGNTLGDNLVWDTNFGIRVDYKILDHLSTAKSLPSWTDWVNEGIENNSLYADPCLDISGGIISFTCSNSHLDQIGFQTIPSDIGLIK
jgi:parallel beta-helix repeat protein